MTIDGSRAKARRLALKFSQADVAVRSGLRQSSISKLEKGGIDGRVRETQDRLARALLTTADYLCGLTAEPGPVPAFIPAMRDGLVIGDAPARTPEDDEIALESALFDVMDRERFSSRDFDLARLVVRESHRRARDDGDLNDLALEILSAPKAERAENPDAGVKEVVMRWAYGKQTPAQRAAAEARAKDDAAADAARAKELGYGEPGDVPSPLAPTKPKPT